MFDSAALVQTLTDAAQPTAPVRPFPATTAAMKAFTEAHRAMQDSLQLPFVEQGKARCLR
jgi:hypothetical protein